MDDYIIGPVNLQSLSPPYRLGDEAESSTLPVMPVSGEQPPVISAYEGHSSLLRLHGVWNCASGTWAKAKYLDFIIPQCERLGSNFSFL